jgi:hypothetical protein
MIHEPSNNADGKPVWKKRLFVEEDSDKENRGPAKGSTRQAKYASSETTSDEADSEREEGEGEEGRARKTDAETDDTAAGHEGFPDRPRKVRASVFLAFPTYANFTSATLHAPTVIYVFPTEG